MDKQKLQLESAGRDKQKKRIADMGTFLREQPIALTEYGHPPSSGCDALFRRLIEKVTVYTVSADTADKFTVEFKPGVTVDVDE